MKKTLAFLLLAFLMLSFCSCGEDEIEPETTDENAVVSIVQERKAEEMPAAESYESGTGKNGDPYIIADVAQLALMCNQINDGTAEEAHFALKNDIEFNDTSDFSQWGTKAPKYKWKGITRFSGTLNGNGHTISGLYACEIGSYYGIEKIDTENGYDAIPGAYELGFVRSLNGQISNLKISESFFECLNNADVGIFAGDLYGIISNCSIENTAVKSRIGSVGGFCGVNHGGIENCQSDEKCSVYNAGGFAGGFCGYAAGDMSNCIARGNVTAGEGGGGFAGHGTASGTPVTFKNLQNYAKVESTSDLPDGAGGCFGSVSPGLKAEGKVIIDGCINYSSNINGMVSGGIAGKAFSDISSDLNIQNCVNKADVSSDNKFGGIIGEVINKKGKINIVSCINEGDIISDKNPLGGMVSAISLRGGETNFTNCENKGKIKAAGYAAGGILPTVVIMDSEKDNPIKLNLIGCINSGDIGGVDGGLSTGGIAGDIGGLLGTAYVHDGGTTGILFTHEWNQFVVKDCINRGKVTCVASKGSTSFAGGIIGIWGDKESTCKIQNCVNEGIVESVEPEELYDYNGKKFECGVGGIIGLSNENIVIDGCRNAGKLNVPEYALKGDIFASDKGLFNKVADN